METERGQIDGEHQVLGVEELLRPHRSDRGSLEFDVMERSDLEMWMRGSKDGRACGLLNLAPESVPPSRPSSDQIETRQPSYWILRMPAGRPGNWSARTVWMVVGHRWRRRMQSRIRPAQPKARQRTVILHRSQSAASCSTVSSWRVSVVRGLQAEVDGQRHSICHGDGCWDVVLT